MLILIFEFDAFYTNPDDIMDCIEQINIDELSIEKFYERLHTNPKNY